LARLFDSVWMPAERIITPAYSVAPEQVASDPRQA
jgi:hypothetical protein